MEPARRVASDLVVRDAMTNLTSVEPTIYQPLSGRGLPQAIVRDGTSAQAVVTDLVGRLESRVTIRARPLSSNPRRRCVPRGSRRSSRPCSGWRAAGVRGDGGVRLRGPARTHEIGSAHGPRRARVSHVVGVVVRSSLLAIAGGAVAGLVGAFLASGLLRRYLFGLSAAADPLAHLGVLVVLTLAGAAATFVPARNAARIEPVNALRHE